MNYPNLFATAKIGKLELKNKIVMTAMGCGLANENGTLTDEFIAYYEERAKGGAGLIITEVTCVNSVHGVRAERQIYVTDDIQLPMLTKFSNTIHKYDSKVFVQLLHPGVMSSCSVNGGKPLTSPSGIMSKFLRQPARELSNAEIKSLVKDFANGAARAKKAGIDGVEIHAAHHYLIHEFLSPYFNKRTDEYGGSFENRCRFLKEVVIAVREAVGADYPITVRLSAEDYMGDESYHLDECIKVAQMLDALGVDGLNISVGGTENGKSHSLEPISYRQGWRKHISSSIKKMVNCPVIGTSVIRDPEYAEKILENNEMDLIGMGRSHLADPYWSKKAQSGHTEDICKCISCLRCIDNIKFEKPIICSLNPNCGNELNQKEIVKNGNGRLAVVVGAGVAGLEAARILSEREFKVVLFEKTMHLGGQVYLASNVPNKEKMKWFIEYETTQLHKHNVDIRFGSAPSADEIIAMNPYIVIDATGASPLKPGSIEGINNEFVITPVDVLSGTYVPENKNIAIIGSGLTGLETAELLVEKGNAVTIIEMADKIAPGGSKVNINDILQRLAIYDTILITNKKLTKIESDRIHYEDVTSGEEYILPVDNVILSLGVRSNGTLGKELKDKFYNIKFIGDAQTPGRIREAIVAGYTAGMEA